MVDLNRKIRATQARQGGFSSHVLPEPVSYAPLALPHIMLAPDITEAEDDAGFISATKNRSEPTLAWNYDSTSNFVFSPSTGTFIGLPTGGPANAPALRSSVPTSAFGDVRPRLKAAVNNFPSNKITEYTAEVFIKTTSGLISPPPEFATKIEIYAIDPSLSWSTGGSGSSVSEYFFIRLEYFDRRSSGVSTQGKAIGVTGFRNAGEYFRDERDGAPFMPAEWTHVALVQEPAIMKVFVNGQMVYSNSYNYAEVVASLPDSSSVDFYVEGQSYAESTTVFPTFSGYRFTPRALYTANFTPPASITDFA
jgi:hypothetical protein